MPLSPQAIRHCKIIVAVGYMVIGLGAAAFIPVNIRQVQAATAAGLTSTNPMVSLVLNIIMSLVGLYGVFLLVRAVSRRPSPTADDHSA